MGMPASSLLARLCPPAAIVVALAVAGCGANAPPPSDEQQIRATMKAVTQAFADEDYQRLCAQWAPGTFKELLAAADLRSCEDFWSRVETFEAPTPRQINAARVRIDGDHANVDFREPGVETALLTRIDGRWLLSNEAEISGADDQRS